MNELTPKQQRFFSVYVLPLTFAIVLIAGIWYASVQYGLDKTDEVIGYIIVVFCTYVFITFRRLKWLPLPDGSYVNTNNFPDEQTNTIVAGPLNYQYEYYTTLSSKIISVVLGLVLVGVSLFIFSGKSIFVPALCLIMGMVMIYSGYKEFMDKSPKLKLSKEGLWTKQLGFKPWATIVNIEVKVVREGKSSKTKLIIYLKDSLEDSPDEELTIDDLTDKDEIEDTVKMLSGIKAGDN